MAKKLKDVVKDWFDKYGNDNQSYSVEKITEIATNCTSLSKTWFDRVKNIKGASYEILLFNKEGTLSETLNGVTENNIVETMLDILANKSNKYSKISFNYFKYENGEKKDNLVGELEIC